MARTADTESVLDAATLWRDRCLLEDRSVFSDGSVWTREHLAELRLHFTENPDNGDRTFLEKLREQLEPASVGAKQLAAEMLWVLFLFPSNISREKKVENISIVWSWSGTTIPPHHSALTNLAGGIGGAGQAYNTHRALELQFFIRVMQDWKDLPGEQQFALASDPWGFAEWIDAVEGAERRPLRHMLLHLLFPETFERVSSPHHKASIDAAFKSLVDASSLGPGEAGTTPIARDRRLLRIRKALEREQSGGPIDFYVGDVYERWKPEPAPIAAGAPLVSPQRTVAVRERAVVLSAADDELARPDTADLRSVLEALQSIGLRVSARTLRRYYLALEARGFVVLSGVSGTGKTWLAEAYADATGARVLVVPVAPNWTTNEDLLGFADPISGAYRDTAFSRFLRAAAAEYEDSRRAGRQAREHHLVLDEMNLARVEYYFATFLSGMELRVRAGEARIELGPDDSVQLPPNLKFIGTINVDETTHGFADKVYDRAHVIEMRISRDELEEHLGGAPYRVVLLEVWDIVQTIAPFAFRVLDDAGRYVASADRLGVPWEELVDEIILQKVLPKIRGADPQIGDALSKLEDLTVDRFPLSYAKVSAMRNTFQQHGVASYF